jgi:Ca-activated chloride channel homolog
MKNKLWITGAVLTVILTLAFTALRTISGIVTDSSGQPIPGVNISIKGNSSKTNYSITDQNGRYKISVDSKDQVLVFSFIGFKTSEVKIGDKSTIDVVMNEDVTALSETIVVGYSTKHKEAARMYDMAAPSAKAYNQGGSFRSAPEKFNTEGYAYLNENGFRNVKSNPLSTFSIDVDNASYSNIRRFINMGELPPPDAVRIEEMINYFKYDYPEPDGEYPFSVYTELASCPWNEEHQLVQIGLRGKSIDKSSLPPSNLVFLIDVSGSMSDDNKLPLLKSAFSLLVNELRSQDRVSIVVYAGAAGLVLESTPGNNKQKILGAIQNLEAGGSTAGGAGLRLAYREAEKNFVKGGNNRIILATDGDFNVGESSNGGMERLVEEKRELGVFMTVLGFGMGNVKDDKMELIADKGNGNYSYIDNLQEARRVLVKEFGGTLFTIAKDVKFQIEFNPEKVASYRLIGYENRLLNDEDFNDDKKDAGEMGSGHNVTALYELVPAKSGHNEAPSVDPLKYQSNVRVVNDHSPEYLTIKIRYKKPSGSTSILYEKPFSGIAEDISEASDNLKTAAAVAELGMILRNSEFKGSATLKEAAILAREGRGADEDGYRSELVRLINTLKDMNATAEIR